MNIKITIEGLKAAAKRFAISRRLQLTPAEASLKFAEQPDKVLGLTSVKWPRPDLPVPGEISPMPRVLPPTDKPTNPKDMIGASKPPQAVVSQLVLMELGVAMLEGTCKYGRHNYRVAGVRASIYYDAARRHLDYWWEGEDIDPDSELSHVTKAIASLVVLRDSMLLEKFTDDRPPRMSNFAAFKRKLELRAKAIIARYEGRDVTHATHLNTAITPEQGAVNETNSL